LEFKDTATGEHVDVVQDDDLARDEDQLIRRGAPGV
jgi:hypothetical protein